MGFHRFSVGDEEPWPRATRARAPDSRLREGKSCRIGVDSGLLGNAARKVDSLFCLDGIAAGTVWANMQDLNVDLYITAPQKGWTSPASCGVVMLGERSLKLLENTQSNSFTYDLNKWNSVTDAYMDNNFMYHFLLGTTVSHDTLFL